LRPTSIDQVLNRLLGSQHISAQAVRHLMVGGTGVLINWTLFSFLRGYLEFSTLSSTLICHAVMIACIFPMQKFFTFNERSRPHRQFVKFLINDAFYITFDYLFAYLFIDVIGLIPVVGKLLGLALLTPMSFMSQRFWVFAVNRRKESLVLVQEAD